MKVEIHSLYWDNAEYLVDSHKKVMNHFNIPVNYHNINGLRHGIWLDDVMSSEDCDIVGFIEPDCIPLNDKIIKTCIEYVTTTKTMIGTAQCSNHIAPFNHIFVAPSFMFIDRQTWINLGRPSFKETPRGDVAEEISWKMDENKMTYRTLYPKWFEKIPPEGIWNLSNYGYFGIGTVFVNSVYHLFQGRTQENQELFNKRCEEVVSGNFSTSGFTSSI